MRTKQSAGLIRGHDVLKLLGASHVGIRAMMMRSKSRDGAVIRFDEYVERQPLPVRDALRALMKNRMWKFVPFHVFMNRVEDMAEALIELLRISAKKRRDVVFAVDSLKKSSFWVLSIIFLIAGTRLISAIGGDVNNISLLLPSRCHDRRECYRQIASASIVFVDDVVYSGDQMSTFVNAFLSDGVSPGHVFVAVPYMSTAARRRFQTVTVVSVESCDSLFHKRSVSTILKSDLFLRVEDAGGGFFYMSYFFQFLDILSMNTTIMFEHKVADAISIPFKWLVTGPVVCPKLNVMGTALRIKPDRALSVARSALEEMAMAPKQKLMHWEVGNTISYRLSHDKNMEDFETVDLVFAPRHHHRREIMTPFFPLLPPDYCNLPYKFFLAKHLPVAPDDMQAFMRRVYMDMPECHIPPYKRQESIKVVEEMRSRLKINLTFVKPKPQK